MPPSPGRQRGFKPKFVHGNQFDWVLNQTKKRNLLDYDSMKDSKVIKKSGEIKVSNFSNDNDSNAMTTDTTIDEISTNHTCVTMDAQESSPPEDGHDNTSSGASLENNKEDQGQNFKTARSLNRPNYDLDDVEPFLVHIESLPGTGNFGNLHPLSLGKKLFGNNIDGIAEVKRSNKNRVVCTFKTAKSANAFLNSDFGKDNNVNVYIPSYQLERLGLVRHVDVSLTEDEILENLQGSNDIIIVSVKRLTKKVPNNDGEKVIVPLPLISIKFKGKRLPDHVYLFYNRCSVEPYVSNPVLCFKCVRYGHTSRNCKSKIRCPNCHKDHSLKDCDSSNAPSCLFCNGPHSSLSRLCPEFDVQKRIKEVMAYRNLPYRDAKLFLFPENNKSEAYSKVLGVSDYDEAFPALLSTSGVSNPLKEKLPLPARHKPTQRKSSSPSNPIKIHQNVTLYKDRHAQPSVHPKFTNRYYKQFQNDEPNQSKPVFLHKSRDLPQTSNEEDKISAEVFLNTLHSFKKNEISIDDLINKLKPMINLDLNKTSNIDRNGYISDDSF